MQMRWVVAAAAFACSSMADLPGLSFRSGTQISMVGSSLLSSR